MQKYKLSIHGLKSFKNNKILQYQWHKKQNWTLVEVGFFGGFLRGFFRWVHP